MVARVQHTVPSQIHSYLSAWKMSVTYCHKCRTNSDQFAFGDFVANSTVLRESLRSARCSMLVLLRRWKCSVLQSLRNYQSVSTWMTSSTRVRGPCTPSVSCVHATCALHFFSRSFSQSSSQSSPTLLQRGRAFRRLLTASALRHFYFELLDLACGRLRRQPRN